MGARYSVFALCLQLALAGGVRAQSNPAFFPLNQVHAGLKGFGRTIFAGSQPQTFQVEILGVLKNALAPKRDVILARLSGGPLATTGVIAGMSGSPVYIDGKLLGAVALGFQFSKAPIAGITPIGEMLAVVPGAERPSPASASTMFGYRVVSASSDPQTSMRLIPETPGGLITLGEYSKALGASALASPLTDLRLPLSFGGFAPGLIDRYTPIFRDLGFEPMAGGVLSGGESGTPIKGGPEPGSMISMMLVHGDLNMNADCTVTYRTGDRLYACGHQVLMTGPSEIPFAQAKVLTTIPDLLSSFKVDAPGPLAGTIRQDRFGAIFGVIGQKAPTIPVHITVATTLNRIAHYQFDIIDQKFLSPLLLNLGVVSTLRATERNIGPSTLEMKGDIRLSNGQSVKLDNVVAGIANAPAITGATVATPLTYLLESGFPNLRIEGVNLTVTSLDNLRVATLEQAWSTKSKVRPGEHLEIIGLLRTSSGKILTERIPVTIPASVTDSTLSLVVGSGANLNFLQNAFSPVGEKARDIGQLVRALNRMRRNNRLYALLMSPQQSLTLLGEKYPSPPPSMLETFLPNPAASSNVIFGGASVIGDFETAPLDYAIQGMKMLFLQVAPSNP